MHVFLDESGIHLKSGHSVFALVYIEVRDLPLIKRAVLDLETGINPSSLHWKDMAWPVRLKVFAGIQELPFRFETVVVNNPVKNLDMLTTQVLGKVLAAKDDDINAIYIDGRKSQAYEARLKKALRDAGIKTRKLKTVNDKAYPGVQLADLIAGLHRHQLDKPSVESARLQRMIARKQA